MLALVHFNFCQVTYMFQSLCHCHCFLILNRLADTEDAPLQKLESSSLPVPNLQQGWSIHSSLNSCIFMLFSTKHEAFA